LAGTLLENEIAKSPVKEQLQSGQHEQQTKDKQGPLADGVSLEVNNRQVAQK